MPSTAFGGLPVQICAGTQQPARSGCPLCQAVNPSDAVVWIRRFTPVAAEESPGHVVPASGREEPKRGREGLYLCSNQGH
jgi:hypothetical protein